MTRLKRSDILNRNKLTILVKKKSGRLVKSSPNFCACRQKSWTETWRWLWVWSGPSSCGSPSRTSPWKRWLPKRVSSCGASGRPPPTRTSTSRTSTWGEERRGALSRSEVEATTYATSEIKRSAPRCDARASLLVPLQTERRFKILFDASAVPAARGARPSYLSAARSPVATVCQSDP